MAAKPEEAIERGGTRLQGGEDLGSILVDPERGEEEYILI